MSESRPYLRGLKSEKYYTFLVKREYFFSQDNYCIGYTNVTYLLTTPLTKNMGLLFLRCFMGQYSLINGILFDIMW